MEIVLSIPTTISTTTQHMQHRQYIHEQELRERQTSSNQYARNFFEILVTMTWLTRKERGTVLFRIFFVKEIKKNRRVKSMTSSGKRKGHPRGRKRKKCVNEESNDEEAIDYDTIPLATSFIQYCCDIVKHAIVTDEQCRHEITFYVLNVQETGEPMEIYQLVRENSYESKLNRGNPSLAAMQRNLSSQKKYVDVNDYLRTLSTMDVIVYPDSCVTVYDQLKHTVSWKRSTCRMNCRY